ncbi:MAG: magnesium-translocating P-type ATPase [Alphaproteobacteria bacterium]|nr:magnesium-translocating P-type ATPase [Alphaproteobacteria bacterium]
MTATPLAPDAAGRPGEDAGLGSAEAARRLAEVGPNLLAPAPRAALLRRLAMRFANPLVLVLLGAAAVAAATGDLASFVIIAAIVALSVALDVAHEHGAERAAERLRARVALTVNVLRDGKATSLPASRLVPGDVVLLGAGDLVPADGEVLAARDLFVNEALLTGESVPVEKHAGGAAGASADRLFMGSSIVTGSGRAVVRATGRRTQIGDIAATLRREPPPTAFAIGLGRYGLLIVRLTILLTFFVLLANLLFERPLLQSLLFALALAVGLTPELLPMVVTVTLAHGALRMSRKDVIVKRLGAIHDLGSMDVLCSDKTGTLTEAHIRLIRQVDPGGADSSSVLRLAYLNSAFETGLRSPLDEAVLEHGAIDITGWRKIDEVPFDFERRRVSVLVEHGGRRQLIVKGAPEDVLRLATQVQYEGDAAPRPLDGAAESLARRTFEDLGREGFRTLAVACREVEPDRDHARVDDETSLVFVGFAAFIDPPKESARLALQDLASLGVTVKVLTGDNEQVTQYVCRAIGLDVAGVLTGDQIAELSDEALLGRIESVSLFCRMKPAQKERIIRLLRRRGHVVGYLGDGINDAPSLHAADVGLSVDSAVDVAREAATMIMLRHELGAIVDGVREGRRTFANIMKYVMTGGSSNLGNMLSMAASVLLLPFLPMLPVQILLNNLLYDLSEMAIPADRVDDAMVARPPHWDMGLVWRFMLVFGLLSSVFDMLTFGLLWWGFGAGESLFQTGWFVESLATQALVILVIRTRGLPWRSRPHGLLVAAVAFVVVVAAVIPVTPLAPWFGFVALPSTMLLALAAMVAAYLIAVQLTKSWFLRFAARRA